LPSLFDEEELAEVGLKASPFGDSTAETATDDNASGDAEDALAPAQAPDVDEGALADDLETDLEGSDRLGGQDDADDLLDNDLPDDDHDLPDLEASPYDDSALNDGLTSSASEAEDAAAAPQLTDGLQEQLNAIQHQLTQLGNEFGGKLKYDAHKDQIIDKLHQELQEYKQDIVKKHILSVVLDVVKVADDIRKWIAYFRSLEVSQRDPVKLFRYLEAIPSDLEDIFYWQGVKPYVNREGPFNPAKQRAIKKIPTGDSTKDKTIAKSIRPGYEWEGKVIRQEMVAVYVYEEDDDNESAGMRNIDE